jgi:hypothetical protein
VVVAACGGAAPNVEQPRDTRDLRAALIAAADDPAALAKLLRGSVTNGGLWFADPACVFPVGQVTADRLPEFARCLAGLHMRRSLREDALADVVVLQYDPGFEIEARVIADSGGPRLTWIGYEARRDDDDALPTINAALFESLRVAGDRNGPVVLAGDATAEAWLKVCIDDTGSVTSADLRAMTSIDAGHAFVAAARTWKFRPFTLGERVVPVCAMLLLKYPPTQRTADEILPLPPQRGDGNGEPALVVDPKALELKRTGGEKNIVPDDETKVQIEHSGLLRIAASFKMCIDKTGHVASIRPLRLTGFAAYDQKLAARIQKWTYSPFLVDGKPVPVCAAVTFIYMRY